MNKKMPFNTSHAMLAGFNTLKGLIGLKKWIATVILLSLFISLNLSLTALAAKEYDVDGILKSIENDPGFVNDYDPRITYTGPWSKNSYTPAGGVASNGGRDWTAAYAGGGRAYLAEISGATVEFSFVGPSIMVLMTRYPDLGSVEFTLDGGAAVKVDLTCTLAQADDNYAAFKKTGLSDGMHTIKMKSVDAPGKNGNPPGPGYIHLIGFVTDNGIINSSNAEYVKNTGFTLKTDAESNQTATCCIGDDLSVSTAKDSTMTFTFEGSYVGILSKVGSGYGRTDVEIDGAKVGTVDLNETKTAIQRMVFTKGGLSSGKHTLKLTALDDKTFTVDAFIIKKAVEVTSSSEQPTASLIIPSGTGSSTDGTKSVTGSKSSATSTTNGSAGASDITNSTDISDTGSNNEESYPIDSESTDPSGEKNGGESSSYNNDGKPEGNPEGNPAVTKVIIAMIILLLLVGATAAYLLWLKPKMDQKRNNKG